MSDNPLRDLKDTVIEFIDDIRTNIITNDEHQTDFTKVKVYFQALPGPALMTHAIKHVLPRKREIEKRNKAFFINNKEIFKGLPEDRIAIFSEKFKLSPTKGGISNENLKIIWDYWDTILSIIEEYKKEE